MKRISNLVIPGLINRRDRKEGNIPATGINKYVSIMGTPGAKFTLTIVNIDDRDILIAPLFNVEIPENGRYRFSQVFPKTTATNKYKINLKPGDNTIVNRSLPTTDPMWTINQYANVTLTFTKTSDLSGFGSFSGSDVTISGQPDTGSANINLPGAFQGKTEVSKYLDATYTVTAVAESSDITYIKNITAPFSDNNDFTKKVGGDVTNSNVIKLSDTAKVGASSQDTEIKKGMTVTFPTITKTKFLGIDEDNEFKTDKIRLNNTFDIEVGMVIKGLNFTVVSIENDKDITLSSKVDMLNNITLTFEKPETKGIAIIQDVNFSTDEITISRTVTLKKHDTLTISDEKNWFSNVITTSGSGTQTAIVTNNIRVHDFPIKDITFTFSLDDVFTLTPNAYDQHVDVIKNTATDINVLNGDNDENVGSKVPIFPDGDTAVSYRPWVKNGKLTGSFGAGDGTLTYTPNRNFVGRDKFEFYVSDGGSTSDIKTVYIRVKE